MSGCLGSRFTRNLEGPILARNIEPRMRASRNPSHIAATLHLVWWVSLEERSLCKKTYEDLTSTIFASLHLFHEQSSGQSRRWFQFHLSRHKLHNFDPTRSHSVFASTTHGNLQSISHNLGAWSGRRYRHPRKQQWGFQLFSQDVGVEQGG